MILVAAVLIDAGRGVEPLFDLITLVRYNQPNYIPELYTYLGGIVVFLAVVIFAAASFESRTLLSFYWVFSVLLMLFLIALSVQINISSHILKENMRDKCHEVMPKFEQSFYKHFNCASKYATPGSQDITHLTCPKQDITLLWENNLGLPISQQREAYSCLNDKCCSSMIAFIKGKFDKLASIAIVTAALLLVGITTAGYMAKKL